MSKDTETKPKDKGPEAVPPPKPFVPAEDEQGNPVAEKSLAEIIAGKKSNIGEWKIYKTITPGVTPIPVMINNKKRYLRFDKHVYRTQYIDEQTALEAILAEDVNQPINRRRVLTEDEFLSHTSPEKMYMEIDGMNLHITEVREAVKVAKKNGWKPTGKVIHILSDAKSKISQGGRSSGTGGI